MVSLLWWSQPEYSTVEMSERLKVFLDIEKLLLWFIIKWEKLGEILSVVSCLNVKSGNFNLSFFGYCYKNWEKIKDLSKRF